jgi:hypothetical protein
MEQEKKKFKNLHKLLISDKGGDFFSGGKTSIINKYITPLSVNDPYMDPWRNPLLQKGVPQNQKQLLQSTHDRKALFVTKIEKPFQSRLGGNKSTTLPNDLFDVIAEAEETGGAIQRHLGTTTSRFGLPTSVDNRDYSDDPNVPKPPIRTSTLLKSTRPRFFIVF